MSAAIEAVGDMATGAALAHAVEPATGGGTPATGHTACLNCGTALAGHYCHACGQSGHVHKTLMSIVHDLAHGVFHFEGKIWRTVPMLVLHPGQLTRRYIDGERARFVSPLALFLFTVFLMFAIYSTFASEQVTSGIVDGWNKVPSALQEAQAKTGAELARAVADRGRLAAARQPTAAIDRRIAALKNDLASAGQSHRAFERASDDGKVRVRSDWQWLNEGARARQIQSRPGRLQSAISGL